MRLGVIFELIHTGHDTASCCAGDFNIYVETLIRTGNVKAAEKDDGRYQNYHFWREP
jgi:hypothetical protein